MLLKYINSNRISVIILFLLLPIVYWLPSLFGGGIEQFSEPKGVLFGRWIIELNENFRVGASLLALLLIMLNGYLLIQLNIVYIFIPFRTQLPLMFYALLTISMVQLHHLTPALVASTLVILVFFRIFSAYKTDGISINFLDAGLLISLASLFYFPALGLYLFLLASMMLLRPFNWREWAFSFIGLILPYIFVLSIYYLLEISINDFFNDIAVGFVKASKDLYLSQIINWSYIGVIMLVCSYYMAAAIDSMKIHARKFFLISLAFFITSVLIFITITGAGTSIIYFIAIPLSYLFSFYFGRCKRNWINELLFGALLILLIWQRIN